MLIHKLAAVFITCLFFASCQHTTLTSAVYTEKSSSPLLQPEKIPDTQDVKTDANGILTSENTNPYPGRIKKNPDKKTASEEKAISISNRPGQDKIDQALELCTYAQQMWETGKLEEALTSLDAAYSSILEIDDEDVPEINQQKEDIRYLISKRILEIYASRQITVNGQHKQIPITMNQYVQNEINRLTGPERTFFIQSLERSAMYRPFILSELKKAGLPEELSWLPLIESGFKVRALSSARALGIWQFIPSTGYKFGLNRDHYIDERLDPEKSTLAAISYLKELHNLFGDWTTALAAYNCGENRVLRIIRKQKINYLDNFWDLYQNLPRETSRYVPRFLATLHIINNLEKYDIQIENPKQPVEYTICEIKKQVLLKDIAKEIGVNESVLKELNAELRHALLPEESYPLKIPTDKAELFVSKIDTIKTTYSPPPMYVFHRVGKGQTLSGIAKRYRTSVKAISTANNIDRHHRIYAGKVLKIPSRLQGVNVNTVAAAPLSAGQTVSYKVQRGDNLWNIARKFNISTKSIISKNHLSTTQLSIGQSLLIASGSPQTDFKDTTTVYQVRSGDSPFSIAKKHKISLNKLLALNHLSKASKIFPGQKLIIE
ncbi:MAG: LysM peptidoglycan-binding domain-containing protein [Proteobacteria bacterium]|nr:LysM peptidoglycan-binding domain-containing protein [Pseudomonadota bacterium]MBU1387905.1 LysM peptidoglycan-binding domain-containing protein [Pseudomonadota bacterium]MBU1541968.1 LysM peptidoglycan-binding domain-containing protein [Pseudomonadota bacterium]MBU2481332.1 LysM peptidoglycan-binding domain-containing protein [Pseudomonadota bacterium]